MHKGFVTVFTDFISWDKIRQRNVCTCHPSLCFNDFTINQCFSLSRLLREQSCDVFHWVFCLYQTPVGKESCVSQQSDITSSCHCRTAGWCFWLATSSAGLSFFADEVVYLDHVSPFLSWQDAVTFLFYPFSPPFFCMRELYLADASLAWWTADWTGQTWQLQCHGKVTEWR